MSQTTSNTCKIETTTKKVKKHTTELTSTVEAMKLDIAQLKNALVTAQATKETLREHSEQKDWRSSTTACLWVGNMV